MSGGGPVYYCVNMGRGRPLPVISGEIFQNLYFSINALDLFNKTQFAFYYF